MILAAAYAVTVTLCATPAHTDCETATVHTIPRPGDSEPWCDGMGPINAAVALTLGFTPGRQGFLLPGSIECRPA